MNTTKTFRVLPGYSHVSKRRDLNDEFTGRVAVEQKAKGDEVFCETYSDQGKWLGDVWLKRARLQVY